MYFGRLDTHFRFWFLFRSLIRLMCVKKNSRIFIYIVLFYLLQEICLPSFPWPLVCRCCCGGRRCRRRCNLKIHSINHRPSRILRAIPRTQRTTTHKLFIFREIIRTIFERKVCCSCWVLLWIFYLEH